MEMKEMVYGAKRVREVLVDDTYKGIRFIVLNLGTHPCCYVACSKEFAYKHCNEYGDIEGIYVHGGVTFSGVLNEGGEHFFGWDYAHCNDWAGYYSDEENIAYHHIKYTTEELVADCKEAIDDFLALLADDNKKEDVLTFAETILPTVSDVERSGMLYDLLELLRHTDPDTYESFLVGWVQTRDVEYKDE